MNEKLPRKNSSPPRLTLSDAQLERCLSVCPEAVIKHAFENLTPHQQAAVAIRHPELILRHAGCIDSADCLRSCAAAAPCTAIGVRSKFPSAKRPILLARSYASSWHGLFGHPDPEMHQEILASLFGDPDEWLLAHDGSFPALLAGLWKYHKLALLPKFLTRLLEIMPSQHEAIINAVARSI